MDKQQYQKLADVCLERVTAWLEKFDPDELDYATSDGVVTLVFPDGARYVLNRQAAASQMWFAASARAWHYRFDAAANEWLDDRDGHHLFDNLASVVAKKLNRPVERP